MGNDSSKGKAEPKPHIAAPTTAAPSRTLTTLQKLRKKIDMMDKRCEHLQARADAEVAKSKQYIKSKNKRAALMCLKKKKMIMQQHDQIQGARMNLETQCFALESAETHADTFGVMREGADVLKAAQARVTVDDVDDVVDATQEAMDDQEAIAAALSQPMGQTFDEDEFEAEFAAMQAEEDAKLSMDLPSAPRTAVAEAGRTMFVEATGLPTLPAAPTHVPVPVASGGPSAAELAELAELEAAMA